MLCYRLAGNYLETISSDGKQEPEDMPRAQPGLFTRVWRENSKFPALTDDHKQIYDAAGAGVEGEVGWGHNLDNLVTSRPLHSITRMFTKQ